MDFKILKIGIRTNFIRFRYHGTQWERNFKTLLLLQVATKRFQTYPEFIFLLTVLTKLQLGFLLSFRFLMNFFLNISDSPL